MMKKSDLLNGGVIGCTSENGTCFYFPWQLTIGSFLNAVQTFARTNIATAACKFTDRERES